MTRLKTLILILATMATSPRSTSSETTCPTSCTCKWKSGKQNVECNNQGLITIPITVDVETQVLDMSGNNLQVLPTETFSKLGLVNLQKVYLKKCHLGQIDESAFKGLTNLIELDLSKNLLTSVPSGSFKDTPFLRDLTLSDNPIQKIEPRAFHAIHGLVKLDLSNCQIGSVAPRGFEGIEMLESLKLNGNNLKSLGVRTIEPLSRLHGVALHENPWHCDCHIRALKEYLIRHNIPYVEAPRCLSGSEHVVHRSFAELHLDDFACKPEILPTTRYLEVVAGSNATITCRTNAVPRAHVKWFCNGKHLDTNLGHQKIRVYEDASGSQSSSLLVIYDVAESNDFYCVAENRGGSAEANFTLRVLVRPPMGITSPGHVAGLGAALVLLILIALVVVTILLARLRRSPRKTQHGEEGVQKPTEESPTSPKNPPTITEMNFCNPIRKPPRTPGEISGYLNGGTVFPCVSPTTNPDIINDTKPEPGEHHHTPVGHHHHDLPQLHGEYVRNVDSSLYPSGVWENVISDKAPIIPQDLGEDLGYRNQLAGYPPDYGLPIQENQKTLRVWQKGAVPVLPPVTALKRVLRSSPDEGYQEGGTDV